MKLATYQDGSRDGQLVVVSRDLSTAHFATGTATRLQQVLDDWNFLSPQLNDLYVTLNHGKARHAFPFDPRRCLAPLPRAYQWAEAAACPGHHERLAQAAGQPPAPQLRGTPLLAQGAGDDAAGPGAPAWCADPAWGLDCAAGLAAVTGDVEAGADPGQGLAGVRLLLLVNAWRLRTLQADESARGQGAVQAWPAAAFGPVAVTPDELGEAWQGGRVHATLKTTLNGRPLGQGDCGAAMHFHFGQLVAALARTRRLGAGCVVGTGPISHADAAAGVHSLAERRALETLADGAPRTPWLQPGDRVRIELLGRDGASVFGAIDQRVSAPDEDRGDGPAPAAEAVPARGSDGAEGPDSADEANGDDDGGPAPAAG